MKLSVINSGLFKLDGGAMFGVVPKAMWTRTNPADEHNMCTWALRLLLLEFDDRKILIDTGIGNKQSEKFFSHYYLHGDDTLDGSLKKLGLTRDDITDVILTHLHFDHCGGAIERLENGDLVPTFKNAIFWSNEDHWQWATIPNAREKASFLTENILPIKESGQLKFLKKGDVLYNKIEMVWVHGHTDAMMCPKFEYNGRTIVYMADLLPSVGHIPLPFVMGYDTRPLLTLDEKKAFLDEAVEKNYVLFLEHDAYNECCTVKQGKKYVELDQTFALSTL
jgi:glyoxylase-like metal-dependent hydrolase (beta-lactamase superfamily II)